MGLDWCKVVKVSILTFDVVVTWVGPDVFVGGLTRGTEERSEGCRVPGITMVTRKT